MENENAFFTKFNYLSIGKDYLHNTSDKTLQVDGVEFSIIKLRNNITYTDNREFYRWDKTDFNRSRV